MAVLSAVAAGDGPLSLGELVESTGLPRATAHRLAAALELHGLLRRSGDGRYALGPRLMALGRLAGDAWPWSDLARPALEMLRDETGESAQLYVRDGDSRVCLASLHSGHELRTIVDEGAVLPLGVGSAGRILSGEQSPSGCIASLGERAGGVGSVSSPVVVNGQVVAAVGISGPLARLGDDPAARYGTAVARAAAAVGAAIASAGS